jgi:hypothetical protein
MLDEGWTGYLLLGTGLPACTCRDPGSLRDELLAENSRGTLIRLTCTGCGRTRSFEIAGGARLP